MTAAQATQRVIIGDCVTHWPKKKCRAIITDPPYGIGFDKFNITNIGDKGQIYPSTDWKPIANDEKPFFDWLPIAYDRLQDGGAIYICTRWDVEPAWREAITQAGFTVKQRLIWNKRGHGMGDLEGTFRPTTEDIIFATKGRHVLNSRPSCLIDAGHVPAWQKKWHPHQKPELLLEVLIRVSTSRGDLVVDPFCGSGSTGVVCKRMGRNFIGIEIDRGHAINAMGRLQ